MLQDLRHAFRLLRTQPGFSLVAILTLALGIGATTTLFTVLDATILHPVSYPAPEQLVRLDERIVHPDGSEASRLLHFSSEEARTWKAAVGVFSHLATVDFENRVFVFPEGAEPERLGLREVAVVNEDYFGLLGMQPVLGRGFRPSDANDGAPLAAVLSDRYWLRRYGRDPEVIGRPIRFAGGTATIVGVMSAAAGSASSIWLSGHIRPELSGGSVHARLRDGVSIADAQRRLDEVAGQLTANGETIEGPVRLSARYGQPFQFVQATLMRSLTGAVGAVLLIAAVNVAGMLLGRGMTRRGEIAVRYSLGASTPRIVRQLVTETMLLALIGGCAGVAVAAWSFDALLVVYPGLIPSLAEPRLSVEVLGASVLITMLAGLGVGLYPALRLVRLRRGAFLTQAQSGVGAERRSGGRWMVGVEVSLAVVLLCVSALLVRNIGALAASDMGVDPTSFVSFDVEPTEDGASRTEYFAALLATVRALPEVEQAGSRFHFGLPRTVWSAALAVEGGREVRVIRKEVSSGYLEALGVKAVQGRLATERDVRRELPMTVINEEAARRFFGEDPAVGQMITMRRTTFEVVGVVPDVALEDPIRLTEPEVYAHSSDSSQWPVASIVVRPRGPSPLLPERLREAAMTVGVPAVVGPVRTGEAWIWENASVELRARYAMLLSLFAGLGVLLSAVGIFGVTAYAVARRTREIGVRLALGSSPARAVREMLRETAVPMGLGIVAGLGGAALASKAIAHLLVGISPHDPLTYALVAVTFAGVAMLAAWIPARRAARVDPVIALRAE